MSVLIVLLSSFALSYAVLWKTNKQPHAHRAAVISFACTIIFTALGHFFYVNGMMEMMPEWVPFRKFIVLSSGVFEILGGLALLLLKNKKRTGLVLIVFLILILPLNIYAAYNNINYKTGANDGFGLSYLWFRIPLQFFLIFWLLLATKIIPLKKNCL